MTESRLAVKGGLKYADGNTWVVAETVNLDLPPAEALHQCLDSLLQLNAVMNQVFGKLGEEIAAERRRIQSCAERAGSCANQVRLIGANQSRATTLFAPARYPAPVKLPEVRTLSSTCAPMGDQAGLPGAPDSAEEALAALAVNTRRRRLLTGSQRRQEPVPTDTTNLFATLSRARSAQMERSTYEDSKQEGLGRLPAYLPSVTSVLLFNSDENPYKTYNSFNNLEGVAGIDRTLEEEEIHAAPHTLIEGAELPTFDKLQFDYRPDLGEVPVMDLPMNLPLGRLADIQFGQEALPTIAPSVASPELSLPSSGLQGNAATQASGVQSPQYHQPAQQQQQNQASAVPQQPPQQPQSHMPPPPPPTFNSQINTLPPPPGPQMQPPLAAAGGGLPLGGDLSVAPALGGILPPPPSMPLGQPGGTSPMSLGSAPSSLPPVALGPGTSGGSLPAPAGGRNDLLASIRKGRMLKTVKDRPEADVGGGIGDSKRSSAAGPSPTSVSKSSSPVSMMDALAGALKRRREAVGGAGDSGNKGKSAEPAEAPRMSAIVSMAMNRHKTQKAKEDEEDWDE